MFFRMGKGILSLVFFFSFFFLVDFANSQIHPRNKGKSESIGDYHKGSLKNGYLLPRKSHNFRCYSWLSYYLLRREFVHSDVYKTVLETYSELAEKYPNRKFTYMEASKRKGGRMFPHRTHQSGLSIDFMSPLIRKDGTPKYYSILGAATYALNFDSEGRLKQNKNIRIDFNLIAEHILLLEKNARKHGLRIKKVIFKIELKDNLFQTENGKKLKKAGIYFAQKLTPILNKVHDDHYHVDFELLKE